MRKKLLTKEEMDKLIDKLNKGEMEWEDIEKEVEMMRNQARRPAIKK